MQDVINIFFMGVVVYIGQDVFNMAIIYYNDGEFIFKIT